MVNTEPVLNRPKRAQSQDGTVPLKRRLTGEVHNPVTPIISITCIHLEAGPADDDVMKDISVAGTPIRVRLCKQCRNLVMISEVFKP
jgi:hypothetical protein